MTIETILTSNVVDLTSIKSFFASDKEMLIELIGVYLTDTTPRIKTLEESITAVDYEAVRSICHFLKSSFGLMGVRCLEEITTLEKQAQNNESEIVIKEILKSIIPICEESIIEYKTILDKLKAL
ncbi:MULTISPECIES: Hpt domain-containing protein [unclassified Polaribacter]|uniref:Hpt domain-containing protein n=1 Tax=unclassified Polaribacter TaxID=196858 RepID=UPI0011BEB500|nr:MULTISPECIES: Hpt domain-containing protein [unclassified Polaribacter]TXD50470.1 Hpt domain-containing protein [Polaribacter sp. IC063]TXD56892.1 Hpt domain-containing protein [Polaribacter sp. IC066]